MITLTEADLQNIVMHLRVAADVYREEAKGMRANGQERLAEQFDRQLVDANRLADMIEF